MNKHLTAASGHATPCQPLTPPAMRSTSTISSDITGAGIRTRRQPRRWLPSPWYRSERPCRQMRLQPGTPPEFAASHRSVKSMFGAPRSACRMPACSIAALNEFSYGIRGIARATIIDTAGGRRSAGSAGRRTREGGKFLRPTSTELKLPKFESVGRAADKHQLICCIECRRSRLGGRAGFGDTWRHRSGQLDRASGYA